MKAAVPLLIVLTTIFSENLSMSAAELGSRHLTARFANTNEQFQKAHQTLGDHGVLAIRSRQRLEMLIKRLAPMGFQFPQKHGLNGVDFDREMIVMAYKCGDERDQLEHRITWKGPKMTLENLKLDFFMSYVIYKQRGKVVNRCNLLMVAVPKADRLPVTVSTYHPFNGGKHQALETAKLEWRGTVGAAAGDIAGNLRAEIKTDLPRVNSGQDILIRFTLQNAEAPQGDHGHFAAARKFVYVWDGKYSAGYRNHGFEVRTPDGKVHFLRRPVQGAWNKNVPHPVAVTHDRPYTLPEWREGEFLKSLKQLGLDTTKTGTYAITGIYQQLSGQGKWLRENVDMWGGIIASNTITVEIVGDNK